MFVHQPLSRAMVLSLCLHMALLALVQVQPVAERGAASVINVRIMSLPPVVPVEHKPAVSKPSSQPALRPLPVQVEPATEQPAVAANQVAGDRSVTRQAEAMALNLPAVFDSHWYGAREVDRHPKALGQIQPAYPENARRDGLEGWVKLRLKIDEQGEVTEVEVIEAQPAGVFDRAAAEAFRPARFEPARRQGMPVRYEGFFRVKFELE